MYQSSAFRLTRAVVVSYLVSAAAVFLLSWALYVMKWEAAGSVTAVRIVYFTACMAGGFLAGKQFVQRRLLWGMVAGAVYAGILLTVSQLTGGMGGQNPAETLLVLGICLGGSIVGSFIS